MTELLISEVYPRATVNPILLTFTNGYTNENFKSPHSCKLLQDGFTKSKTVVTASGNLIYAGEEQTDDLFKTVLLVRNKRTGKVRAVETTNVELKPVLGTSKSTGVQALHDTSNLELSRKFGSKKQKQQMEHLEKLKVNTEVVTQQMKSVTVKLDKLDTSVYMKKDTEDMYVPPINREAKRVEDIYEVDKILTEEEYEKIFNEIDGKDYVSDLVPIVKALVNKRQLTNKEAVLALYASTLLNMFYAQSREFSKKSFVICPLSSTLNDITLSNFSLTNGVRRTRPNTLKDKALCHSLVFMLILNNFKLSLDDLATAAKMTIATATLKAKAVGAHISSGDKKSVILKIPLNTTTGFKRRKSAKF